MDVDVQTESEFGAYVVKMQPISLFPAFTIIFYVILLIGIVIFAAVVVIIVASVRDYIKNASSPVRQVSAVIKEKRTAVSYHDHMLHEMNRVVSTYYLTLEFEDGSRREYLDRNRLYGVLIEGDQGTAFIQRDWLVGFKRNI